MYLLDTNVVSELRKPKPHGAVLAWIRGVEDAQLFLSAVTLGEIQAGIEITRQQDPDKAQAIEHWLNQLAAAYNVLDWWCMNLAHTLKAAASMGNTL